MPENTKHSYGWVRDLPDHRDLMYSAPRKVIAALPSSVDLKPQCPAVYDQGQLGSCTANAIGGAFQFEEMKQKQADAFMPSRLFIYYNERALENTINFDNGAAIRDGMKTVNNDGVCPEDMLPYDTPKFINKPPDPCYQEALRHKVISYHSIVQTLNQMKGCLADGYPFVFGFTVYESFESQEVAQSGHMPMPNSGERSLGGHAVMAVGYDDSNQWFIIRNSWGNGWGMQGYFTMPYLFISSDKNCDDFWTIRLVQEN